jgi:hypothetical protein
MIAEKIIRLDRKLEGLGYHYLGGITNRVYRHPDRYEILKLGLESDPVQAQHKLLAFQKCQKISHRYVALGLMPEIYEVGQDFSGLGYPFLREQYVPGVNMGAAYLDKPAFWRAKLPQELTRIYKAVQEFDSLDITQTWQEKLEGMLCPEGYEDWFSQVQQIGIELKKRFAVGWRIHGDLQFGNILALRDQPGGVMLIDWEMSEVMPLEYEFAMLFTFLSDPDGQVMSQFKSVYRQQAPLREMWDRISACMVNQFEWTPDELEKMIIFRMGNAWLYQLTKALEGRQGTRAAAFEKQMEELLNGRTFKRMPVISKVN